MRPSFSSDISGYVRFDTLDIYATFPFCTNVKQDCHQNMDARKDNVLSSCCVLG
jgi:hypothetical protein